jgi:hypothetical protein
MNLKNKINKRLENMSVVDFKLTQWASILLGLIVAKLFPRILSINIWWFIIICVLCFIKPIYSFYLKKNK